MATVEVKDEKALVGVIVGKASGAPGPAGPTGPAGTGVPTGGTTGQSLTKNSNTDFDTVWATVTGGGGGGTVTSVDGQTPVVDLTGSYWQLLTPTSVITSAGSPVAALRGQRVRVDTSTGAVTVNLPNNPQDKTLVAVALEAGGNAVTVNRAGSDVFLGGGTSKTIGSPQVCLWQFQSTGRIWHPIVDVVRALTDGTYVVLDTSTVGVVKPQLTPEVGAGSVLLTDGAVRLLSADYATTAALPSCTYAVVSAGVGDTLTATANGALPAQDGVTPAANDTILVLLQAASLQNGLYQVTQVGDSTHPFILTRSTYADAATDWATGSLVSIAKGVLLGGRMFRFRGTAVTVGTNGIVGSAATTLGDTMFGVNRNRQIYAEDFDGFKTTQPTITGRPARLDGARGFFYGNGAAGEQVSQCDSTTTVGETVPGCAMLETGTTTTGKVAYTPASALQTFDVTQRWEIYCRFKIGTVSDGTNTFNVKIGLNDDITNAGTANGLYFEARQAETNFRAVLRTASVDTQFIDTGVAISTAFRSFAIKCPGDGNAYFFSGNTVVATIALGSFAGAGQWPMAAIYKSAGTTSRDLRVDLFGCDIPSGRANIWVP